MWNTTIGKRLDVDMKHLFLCDKCEADEIVKLKQNRYVETYRNVPIYTKNDKYYIYWELSKAYNNMESDI
jgi:hypothetical protein